MGISTLESLKAGGIKEKIMKGNIKAECIRRLQKLSKSHLNSKNVIDGINSGAISIIRYNAGIAEWTIQEVKQLEKKAAYNI